MKCFEIRINGDKVCTAGVGDSGVLSSQLPRLLVLWEKSGQASSWTEGVYLRRVYRRFERAFSIESAIG